MELKKWYYHHNVYCSFSFHVSIELWVIVFGLIQKVEKGFYSSFPSFTVATVASATFKEFMFFSVGRLDFHSVNRISLNKLLL